MTPAELNVRNQQFWSEQWKAASELISDADLLQETLDDLGKSVYLPVKFRMSFESAVTEVARRRELHWQQFQPRFRSEFARLGGNAPKPDALQEVILGIVDKTPSINSAQLLEQLKERAPGEIINEIERDENGAIYFNDHHGKPGSAPVSGLKHRLSRAKKYRRANQQ